MLGTTFSGRCTMGWVLVLLQLLGGQQRVELARNAIEAI